MRFLPDRPVPTTLAGLLLLACSEGTPPTQPDLLGATGRGQPSVTTRLSPVTTTNASPTSGTPIVACYKPGQGLVYRIQTPGAPSKCSASDIEFTIDQGVPGPEGPVGQTGPKGDTGAQGPAGPGPLTGLTLHAMGVTLPSDGRMRFECPDGKAAVNFGWDITPSNTAQPGQLLAVRPGTDGTKLFWGIHGTPGTTIQVYWTCADAVAGVAIAPAG